MRNFNFNFSCACQGRWYHGRNFQGLQTSVMTEGFLRIIIPSMAQLESQKSLLDWPLHSPKVVSSAILNPLDYGLKGYVTKLHVRRSLLEPSLWSTKFLILKNIQNRAIVSIQSKYSCPYISSCSKRYFTQRVLIV